VRSILLGGWGNISAGGKLSRLWFQWIHFKVRKTFSSENRLDLMPQNEQHSLSDVTMEYLPSVTDAFD